MNKRSNAIVLFLSVATLLAPVAARSEDPTTSRILGGKPIDLQNSAVALILTDSYTCSGALMGPRTVVTAAHCIKAPTAEYRVYVAGREFRVAGAYFNKSYRHDRPEVTLDTVRVDIGALVLDGEAPGVAPIPIRTGLAVTAGEGAVVKGYGASEGGGGRANALSDIGRTAEIKIEEVDGTLFATTHTFAHASTCAGDSGGPLLQRLGDSGQFAAIGIVSAGSNKLDARGNCVQNQAGISLYVDLQSPTAQQFLSQFDLNYASGPNIVVLSTVTSQLAALTRLRATDALFSAAVAESARALTKVTQLADAPRKSFLRLSISRLLKARGVTGQQRVRLFNGARRTLTTLKKLGV